MKFSGMLWDHRLGLGLLVTGAFTGAILLVRYALPTWVYLYVTFVPLIGYLAGLLLEYRKKKIWFQELEQYLEKSDQLILSDEVFANSDFSEAEALRIIMEELNRICLENIEKCWSTQEEYKDYIELWIHEIKTPIAASKLIVENNRKIIPRKLEIELDRIEGYTEEALYYARSRSVEKDYVISSSLLSDIVKEALIKNKTTLIANKMAVSIHDLDQEVFTDKKWIIFMLGQVLQNAIKYRRPNDQKVEIWAQRSKEFVILHVKDNGIGIRAEDIPRIFDRGFTGNNGRMENKRSTGIGLYLCKSLSEKLGINIKVTSEEGQWTCVHFYFTAKL